MDGTTNITTTTLDQPITQKDLVDVVRDTALLATLSIGQWSGLRTDKQRVEELKRQHGATGNVGTFSKNLLTGADAHLKAVRSAFGACRQRHYELTLPWAGSSQGDRGPRLLPNLLFDKYLGEMSLLRKTALEAMENLIYAYPELVQQAQANLGGMADVVYPTADEVRSSFHISFAFDPIPATQSSFGGLNNDMMGKLQTLLVNRQKSMVQQAQEAMWTNVSERVKHLVERLQALDLTAQSGEDQKARFFYSSVEHVHELLTLLPGWNCAGDDRVNEIVAAIQAMLAGLDKKTVKDSQAVRSAAITKGQSVLDRLTAWGV